MKLGRRRAFEVLGLVIGLFSSGCALVPRRGFDYDGLERNLRAHLPVGSTYKQIDAYLSSKDIVHSYDEKGNTVYALIPNVEKSTFVSMSVQIVITLDSQKRLQHMEVKRVGTGP